MSSIRRSSLISITLGLLTVIGASFRSLRLRRRQDTSHTWVWRGQARIIVEVEAGLPASAATKPQGGGCFRIYRPSSIRRFQLGTCDCCHRLLFEYPSFFGRRVIDVQSPKR